MVALGGRMPQIVLNIKRGDSGELSITTSALNLAGDETAGLKFPVAAVLWHAQTTCEKWLLACMLRQVCGHPQALAASALCAACCATSGGFR